MPRFFARSLAVLACSAALITGCARFQKVPPDKYVYVTAKEAFLIDRVAAVSNRSGNVTNGEKLTVLDHARRFVKVKSPRGEIGWIKEKDVATQTTFDAFEEMGTKFAKNPTVGNATVRDEVYMHIAPGRDTERFYRLAEGDKLQLLARATLPKVSTAAPTFVRPPAKGQAAKGDAAKPGTAKSSTPKAKPVAETTAIEGTAVGPSPPVMEDWWLVRDGQGHTGWLYSRMMDVDAPDTLVRYAEGQRIVGAYVLAHVNDPESGQLRDGHPDPDIPIYVTVLSPYKAGLPYDFDQVRVFTWNLKKHRYETAFREKNIEGYLPVVIKQVADPYGKAANSAIPLPAFTYKVLAAEAPQPVPDAVTGLVTPGKLVEKTYRLEGNITRRVIAAGAQAPAEAHPAPEPEKKGSKKKGKK